MLAAASAFPSPWTTKPVRSVICAAGACVPKFQTTADSRFRPGFRKGARSKVWKRQNRMSPRDGPIPTRRPFTRRTKRWSALTCTTKRGGTAGSSITFRKR